MKQQAYGFRDMEYFKLKICDLHKSKYAFTGRTSHIEKLLDAVGCPPFPWEHKLQRQY